jgi:large subunit ribosomal protein L35
LNAYILDRKENKELQMPKLKTHRGVAKRFRVTATGKVVRRRAAKSHLLTKKTRRKKHSLKKTVVLSRADRQAIKRLIPYA